MKKPNVNFEAVFLLVVGTFAVICLLINLLK
jgi:hypothetical protein